MAELLRRRLPRTAKANITYTPVARWDPYVPSDDPHIQKIEILNKEAFPHNIFALVDDFVIECLFASKATPDRWTALHAQRASNTRVLLTALDQVDRNDTLALSKKCRSLTHPDPHESLPDTVEACTAIYLQHEIFQGRRRYEAPLRQYGSLFRNGSLVSVCKVQFGKSIGLGLVAREDIPAATYIIETCSSMSADIVRPPGPSIIRTRPGQLEPNGVRSILGPFRLVNHDCKPNAQICPLKRTHAFIMVSLRDILKGEEITVKYERDGYYGESCLCSTCQRASTRQMTLPSKNDSRTVTSEETGKSTATEISQAEAGEGKKRKRRCHRGGKSGKRRKLREKEDNGGDSETRKGIDGSERCE